MACRFAKYRTPKTAGCPALTTGDEQPDTGPVLGTRVFGGRPPSSRLIRVPWKDVADVGIVISLGVRGGSLDADWVERWVRDKIIARIPGGRHDPR